MGRRGIEVFQSFISQAEHDLMLKVCNSKLDRLMPKYLPSHHDSVIKDYREALVSSLSPYSNPRDPFELEFINILKRTITFTEDWVKKQRIEDGIIPTEKFRWSPPHILDLKAIF